MSKQDNYFTTHKYAELQQTLALRRQHLSLQGPRTVTTLANLDARHLHTFTTAKQAEICDMIADGIIEAVRFESEVYVPWVEIEGFVGPGYDVDDWNRDAAAPHSVAIQTLWAV